MNTTFTLFRTFTLIFLVQLISVQGFSQEVIVVPAETIANISDKVFLLKDEGGSMTYEDVLKPDIQTQFRASDSRFPNPGITNAAIWVRFSLKRPNDERCLLEIGDASIDSVSLYYEKEGRLIVKNSGDRIGFKSRKFPTNLFLFPLDLQPGEWRTYYVRLRSSEAIQFTLRTGTYQSFIAGYQKTDIAEGVYYGFMLMIILYNLFLFAAIRDRIYLYYSLYSTLVALSAFYMKGHDLVFFGNSVDWLRDYPTVIYTLGSISTVVFNMQFLRTWQHAPLWHKGSMLLICLHAVPVVLNITGATYAGITLLEILVLLGSFYLYLTAIAAYRKGYKPAIFYIYAWTAFLAGIVIMVFKDLQLLPANDFTMNAFMIGSSLEVLLLSFALADRINIYKEEKRMAQELALQTALENADIIQKQKKVLKQKVKERTRELEASNSTLAKQKEELKELNMLKDKFFSILSHDIRGPLNSLHGIITLMKDREFTKEELNFFIGELSSTLTSTRNFLDNILHWAISQIKGGSTAFSKIDLHTAATETISIIKHAAIEKSIKIENKIPNDFFITTDVNMVKLVLRNLISNAIKFTPEKGTITLQADLNNQETTVTVADTGTGISKENLSKLFSAQSTYSTKGTANEKGTGIGLLLCKEFLEKNSEKIWVESEQGKGSIFKFTLTNHEMDTVSV